MGPCEPDAVLALVRSAKPVDAATRVLPDVYLIADIGALKAAARQPEAASRLRVYAGYAGWSAGQLADELRQGAWVGGPRGRPFRLLRGPVIALAASVRSAASHRGAAMRSPMVPLVLAVSSLMAPLLAAAAEPYDVIVRGGTVYDGSGGPGRRADVGIRGDRIAAVGDLAKAPRPGPSSTPPAWPWPPASSTCCRGPRSR